MWQAHKNKKQISVDSLLTFVDIMHHLTPIEKEKLRQNCKYVIHWFGIDWMEEEKNQSHPLMRYFGSFDGIFLAGELGDALQRLENKENVSDVFKRLFDTRQFESAYNELTIGNNLSKLELDFEFIKQLPKEKSADIVIKAAQREINLEITVKGTSPEYRKALANIKGIEFFFFTSPFIKDYSVQYQIHKPLSKPTAEKILSDCIEKMKNISKSGFEELHIPKVIDLYIIKKGSEDKVPPEHRTISAKLPRIDELARIKNRIIEKSSQLMPDKPGVLLIVDNDSWTFNNPADSNLNLKDQLEESVYDQSNISALAILSNYIILGRQQNEFLMEDDSFISMQTYNPKTLFTKNKLIILNKYSKFPPINEEKEILKRI
jgi:hypothetical protein